MANAPKKEQGNGKKFQNRLPGEKRNRKLDTDKAYAKRTKFQADTKPSHFGGDTSKSESRNRSLNDKPRFSSEEFKKNKPKFDGERKFDNRSNRSSGGSENQGVERPFINKGPRNFQDKNRSPFGGNPRGSFKKSGEAFTGGDRNGNPRFAGDRSDRPRYNGPNNGFESRGNDRSKYNREGGPVNKRNVNAQRDGEKPKFGLNKRFESVEKGANKHAFDGRGRSKDNLNFDRVQRGTDKSRTERSERGNKFQKIERGNKRFDPSVNEKVDTFALAEKFNKPKTTPGVGLSKFKPLGSTPSAKNQDSFDAPEPRKAQYFEEDKPKTFGIPKADKADTPAGFKGSKREFNRVVNNLEKSASHAKSDEIRLNRYVANSGICSRREADALITQGLVKVNGVVVTELGTKIRPSDIVKVEDRKVIPEKPVYILMNKPKGYITTTDDPEGRKTVMELIDLPGKERIYPIGRLDRNTTGVLLLTNDGEMSQKLMHPSFEIKKVYRATLDKKPSKDHMLQLVEGVELEDGMMAFEQCGFVEEAKENVLGVEIKSGRNRIVRRMFEHFGYEVTALDRVLLGEFDKVKLGRGKWRFLTEKEMNYVDRLKRTKPKSIKS